MLLGEFENITGAEVGYYFYKVVIEPMYNATPESFNKFDFCSIFTKRSIAKAQKIFYEKHPEMKEEEKLK